MESLYESLNHQDGEALHFIKKMCLFEYDKKNVLKTDVYVPIPFNFPDFKTIDEFCNMPEPIKLNKPDIIFDRPNQDRTIGTLQRFNQHEVIDHVYPYTEEMHLYNNYIILSEYYGKINFYLKDKKIVNLIELYDHYKSMVSKEKDYIKIYEYKNYEINGFEFMKNNFYVKSYEIGCYEDYNRYYYGSCDWHDIVTKHELGLERIIQQFNSIKKTYELSNNELVVSFEINKRKPLVTKIIIAVK
jgi:hypothetical protein